MEKSSSSIDLVKSDILTETRRQCGNIKLQTNRYKFTEEVSDLLCEFVKLHQYEKSKEYKLSWNNWVTQEDVKTTLDDECGRLVKEGQLCDIMDRMYKSSRYYYRKKINKQIVAPRARKQYEGLPKDILLKMDQHIIREINGNIDMREDSETLISRFTPAISFDKYCDENPTSVDDLIGMPAETAETRRLQNTKTMERLKKTYKNRFSKIKTNLEKRTK